ncbi:helix-turn-helix transcriptional regulator [Streptomyces sp. SID8381]|uniref:helix-turn-helix domain-containing protein n=1 Tax=unclassified Streptomyces TaxID=2593676 RepID=UPI00039CDC92|nr:helix-turn-helix transcriptional regulator [Streptomyces sp. Amel2xE9]MYX25181.1 helix-turn-helix transcriptional regulator [Streptomyces sp. SID8381]
MSPAPHPGHGPEDLCTAGAALYERALREGHVSAREAAHAPCLLDHGLLHPAVHDPERCEPAHPAAALHRLLRASGDRIARERRREERLTETFGALARIEGPRSGGPEPSALRLLSGKQRINQAITEAVAEASEELLCVQPHAGLVGRNAEASLAAALERDQAMLDRGGRIRTLYQHTLRHVLPIPAYHEQLTGDAEARSLDEVTGRLIVIDRRTAFLPANEDSSLALEVRHPALVSFLATAFDRLWRLATPMYPHTAQQPSPPGITPRQHAIAALLVEGHTDAVIADRLGMNVRTAREHIAKLAATLGSTSRAQLGYLIGRSGILDRER